MGKYQAYPEYKDSGVEWVGSIPAHWVCAKTAHFFKVAMGQTILKEDLVDDGEWPVFSATEGDHYFGRVNDPNVQLNIGDIVIPARGNSIGAIKLVKEKATTSQTTIYCKQSQRNKIQPSYIYYFFSGERKNLFRFTQTAIPQITTEEIGSNPILIPTLEEQEKIASFLDHETAKIDTLIDKQQQLIRLLKEKRQAVISHAVTKGLNPNAPMRESGVEWLGEVPEHWIVTQLKFYTLDMQTGPFGSQLHAEDYVANEIPLINPAHMISGELIPDPNVTVDEATQERLSRHKLSAGDIIFARRGELGRCAVVQEEHEGWLCGTGSLKAKLNKLLTPEYAYLLITSDGVISELSLESKGSTMDNLNTETLGRVRIPVPPKSEQNQILQYVEKVSGKYASLVSKAETAINLMQERRTALISAAVTGKIDVRDWQAPAPMQNKEAV